MSSAEIDHAYALRTLEIMVGCGLVVIAAELWNTCSRKRLRARDSVRDGAIHGQEVRLTADLSGASDDEADVVRRDPFAYERSGR